MGAQGKEKQHLCMNTHDEYEKIAAMIDSGGTETLVSVVKFESYPIEQATASGTTYSSAPGKQEEEIVNVDQRYVRVVDDHGMARWSKFCMV